MSRRAHHAPFDESGPCGVEGCTSPGEYRAPRSRSNVRDYQLLCLEHVRAFNKQWDYFSGMSTDEIEAFRADAVTGHRPTWEREDHIQRNDAAKQARLEEELARFLHGQKIKRPTSSRLNPKERKALVTLELEAPCSHNALKEHYRVLVKRYHPDLHHGDRLREEKFKEITTAYAYLLALYQEA